MKKTYWLYAVTKGGTFLVARADSIQKLLVARAANRTKYPRANWTYVPMWGPA